MRSAPMSSAGSSPTRRHSIASLPSRMISSRTISPPDSPPTNEAVSRATIWRVWNIAHAWKLSAGSAPDLRTRCPAALGRATLIRASGCLGLWRWRRRRCWLSPRRLCSGCAHPLCPRRRRMLSPHRQARLPGSQSLPCLRSPVCRKPRPRPVPAWLWRTRSRQLRCGAIPKKRHCGFVPARRSSHSAC